MKYISVAVDGPAGAGKSSVSKAVAKSLGYTYIDTVQCIVRLHFCY